MPLSLALLVCGIAQNVKINGGNSGKQPADSCLSENQITGKKVLSRKVFVNFCGIF